MRSTLASIVVLLPLLGIRPAAAAEPASPRFPALDNDQAWKRLPQERPPLPVWARVLAASLPKTTGAMLELDYVHRTKNPLGAKLAGKIRWAAADAIGCDYSKRYAEADLKRAGLQDADIKRLDAAKELPPDERSALDFARKLTRFAADVTDEEVAELIKLFGPEKVVAIVHTVAHANFQDRIFLALGVEVEPNGPLPPVDLHLDAEARQKVETPKRPEWKTTAEAKVVAPAKPGWLSQSAEDVRQGLDKQKGRAGRIPLPPPERLAKLPEDSRARTMKIVWSRVSMGYQLVLTKAWFDCMNTFQQEASLDRVFSNTYFWVITRSNDCFY